MNDPTTRDWLLKLAPIAAVLAVGAVLSYSPQASRPTTHWVYYTSVHVVICGLLTWLLLRALAARGWRWAVPVTLVLIMVIGAVNELTQPLVGRGCSLLDWLTDLAGAVAAIALWLVTVRSKRVSGIAATKGSTSPPELQAER